MAFLRSSACGQHHSGWPYRLILGNCIPPFHTWVIMHVNIGSDEVWTQMFLASEWGITTHPGKYPSFGLLAASGPSPNPLGTKTPCPTSEALEPCQLCGRRAKESKTRWSLQYRWSTDASQSRPLTNGNMGGNMGGDGGLVSQRKWDTDWQPNLQKLSVCGSVQGKELWSLKTEVDLVEQKD